ncbi:hypothetical protein WK80_30605 [Burkholderia multivorans]|nr:hypothetical protein WK80_30605 [Burkholderia multivorans]
MKHFAMSHAHARQITRLVAHGRVRAFRRAARAGRAAQPDQARPARVAPPAYRDAGTESASC